jgi:hypothetical protein
MRTVFFRIITQRVVVIPYRSFGKLIGPIFKVRPDRLSRNVGKELALIDA